MKIALLNPPFDELVIRDNYCSFTSKANYLWAPIDLLILSGILKNKFKLIAIDAVAERMSQKATIKRIKSFSPKVIFLLTGTATFEKDITLAKQLYKKDKIKIIALGNIVTFKAKQILENYPDIDAILHNFTSKEIVDYLFKKNKAYQHISYRKKNKIHLGKINYSLNIKEIDIPSPSHELFPLSKYKTPFMQQKPLVTMLTSFGCPFSCKFCVASSLRYTSRSIESLKKEFDHIKKIGVKEIFFQDSTFNANRTFTQNICKLMIKNKYKFTWSANIHSACLDKETAVLMKKAGCHTLQIGIENASDEILKKNSKGTNKLRMNKIVTMCKKLKFNVLGYFIIGVLQDNKKTINETIKYACKLNPTFASFSIATADLGTKMRNEAFQSGQLNNNPASFDSSNSTNINHKNISKQELKSLLSKAYINFYLRPTKITEILFLSIKNKSIIQNLIGGVIMTTKMIFNSNKSQS